MILSHSFRLLSILTCCVPLMFAGCITPAEEQQLKDDIFALQTRLSQVENQNSSLGKEITTQSSRQEASINTRLDKFAIEIQRVKGDIDALRIGVTTGQMPGADPEQEGSLAKTLNDVVARLDALEENQNKILTAIDKAIEAKKPEKKGAQDKGSKKPSTLNDIEDLRTAYSKKRYKVIAEEGGKVLESLKGKKDKQEALFLYADSLYRSGQIREAALSFNDFIDSKPKDNLAVALLRMGDCFKELGDVETAKIYYEELIQKFASSDEAKQAKSKLAKL
jgi:TolA-binding protein